MARPQGWNSDLSAGVPWVNLRVTRVTLAATATLLPAVALLNRRGIWIFNTSTVKLYFGSSAVDTSSPFLVPQVGNQPLPVTSDVLIYGLPASGTPTIEVWEYA